MEVIYDTIACKHCAMRVKGAVFLNATCLHDAPLTTESITKDIPYVVRLLNLLTLNFIQQSVPMCVGLLILEGVGVMATRK